MKKKNFLTILLSLALVAVIGVGATLAYLTDNTQTVNNKFTFDDIVITLKENASVPDGQSYLIRENKEGTVAGIEAIEGSDVGVVYSDILPGATVEKDPYITVSESNAHAYVYAYVTGVKAPLSVEYDTAVWEIVSHNDNGTLLRHEVAKNAAGEYHVFSQVKVDPTADGEETLNDISIKAYAHQADNTDVDTADGAAIAYFTANL